MISVANQLLLQQAIEATRQKRATQHQTVVTAAQAAVTARTAAAAPVKVKSVSKAKPASKPAAKKPTATQPGSGAISPYLESADLMEMADRGQADDIDVANTNYAYETAAADAIRNAGDAERGRVKNVAGANDDAAARGLYDSGIRAGNVGMANADAARQQAEIAGGLGVAKARQIATLGGITQGRATFTQAMIAKAAENGMALPVDPYDGNSASAPKSPSSVKAAEKQRKSPSQNGAVNVRGAATLKKAPGFKSRLKGVRR